MSGGLPKLNMAAVADTDKKKDKKTLKKTMSKLRAAMTPRGSRKLERSDSFDSEEPSASSELKLTGALGPSESTGLASDTDDSVVDSGAYSSLPPELPAPPISDPTEAPAEEVVAVQNNVAAGGVEEPSAAAEEADSHIADEPPPQVLPPPEQHKTLPQFEDAGDVAKAAREMGRAVPAPDAAAEIQPSAEAAAASIVQDPPAAPSQAHGTRAKWQQIAMALAIFAAGVAASEPVIDAMKRRSKKEVKLPVDATAARKKGGWGFA